MDESRSNVPGTFARRLNRKTVYLSLLAAAAVVTIAGLILAPTFNGTASVSAKGQEKSAAYDKEMLAAAINLRSAGGYAVYAERGSSADTVSGSVFDGRAELDGSARVKKDFGAAMNYLKQLPCTSVEGSELGGRSFGPGVYCVDSAHLAGEMVLSAGGDASALFIIKVKGSFSADNNARITLADGARSGNVYVVAEQDATIGAGTDFRSHILAGGNVNVAAGARMAGRTMSMNGAVNARGAELSAESGTLQICKSVELPVAQGAEADTFTNRIFTFTVAGMTVTVPAGQCSAPMTVPSGVQTVQEANSGTFTNMSGTWTGGYALNRVEVDTALSNSSLIGVNRPLRQAIVNIADPGQLLTIHFYNRPAITGVIEICKDPATNGGVADPDIAGVFRYWIYNRFQPTPSGTPGSNNSQVFYAPLNGCSGPITVEVEDGFPRPTTGFTYVSELGPALAAAVGPGAPTGYAVDDVYTDPANFEDGNYQNVAVAANGATVPNPGGRAVGVYFYTTLPTDPSNASQETRIFFVNRSTPGIVKVCKITANPERNAENPGLPMNTEFQFEVKGLAPNGTTVLTRNVTVLAGPAAQGGNCDIARDEDGTPTRFRIGTPVLVRELGPLTIGGDDIVVSRVRTFRQDAANGTYINAGFLPAGSYYGNPVSPNPKIGLPKNNGDNGRAATNARREETVFEFTNIRFRPTTLKICKIAGNGVAQGTEFGFQAVQDTIGGLLPAFTANTTVAAGPAGEQNGFCQIVPGPGLYNGSWNAGSTVTITEAAASGVSATAITSPTSSPVVNLAARTAVLSGCGGMVQDTTLVAYTNSASTGADSVRIDFDGDRKSDASIFTPSQAKWTFAASGSGNDLRSLNFGNATDKLVSADYDGDGIFDQAVFRPSNGTWYIHGTTGVYWVYQWGQEGDIPQAGDFDGDGRADLVVYRPSNGMWYMNRTRDGFNIFQFGVSTDKPIAADYDGDKKMDAAVFRNGQWFIAGTRTGFHVYQFGIGTDRAVPADYDGDGSADVAVYRGGTWFVLGSRGTYNIYTHGSESELPVPADYDGDGRADLATYRATDGKWSIRRSSMADGAGEVSSITLGGGSDVAVPGL